MDELLFEKADHVATLTLNRPDRLNAITVRMLSELSQALVECNRDTDVRVVVLTGAGRGFCAGLDLQDQSSGKGIGGGGSAARRRRGRARRADRSGVGCLESGGVRRCS